MADIRKLYFDLIDDIYPYAECYEDIDRNMSESEMLYNLCCISQLNFTFPIEDEDVKQDYNRIMTLIDLLTILGFKPSLYED